MKNHKEVKELNENVVEIKVTTMVNNSEPKMSHPSQWKLFNERVEELLGTKSLG